MLHIPNLKHVGGELNVMGNQEVNETHFPSLETIKGDLIQYFVRQKDGEIIYHRTESGFRNYRTIISVVTNHYHKRPRIFKLNIFCAEKNLKKDLTVTIIKQNNEQS